MSGVRASKTGNAQAAYNRAADAVRWLVRQWNGMTYRNDATLAAALASSADAPDRLAAIARDADSGGGARSAGGSGGAPVAASYLVRRLAQFREECDVIVPGVANALRAGDLATMGTLVDRSQSLAEGALENQVPETIMLARSARELGAVAASAFGAGFGGAVWAMVARDSADEFLARWSAANGGGTIHPSGAVGAMTGAVAEGQGARPRRGRARFFLTAPGGPARSEAGDD